MVNGCSFVFADFEFGSTPGERPVPRCVVLRRHPTGESYRVWLDGSGAVPCPIHFDENTVLVAYFASAEVSCFQALGWPIPKRILDPYAEFRALTNGRKLPHGNGLLGALLYFGLEAGDAIEKQAMRDLALAGGPYTDEDCAALLAYCEADVLATERLFGTMRDRIDFERALVRGSFMGSVGRMQHVGVPIDTALLGRFDQHWESIRRDIRAEANKEFGVYEDEGFREHLFAEYLRTHAIAWQKHPTGRLCLDDDTFRAMALVHPRLRQLQDAKRFLAQTRPLDVAVGSDGRNRALLSPFGSRTGRNQPSTSTFIFGRPSWMRGLVTPSPGRILAYIDYSQQEFGIAAALSGDSAMQTAYLSGDPYLEFAKQSGAIPRDATKESHRDAREQFKACVLGVLYGMGATTLAYRIGRSEAHAAELLMLHRRTYRRFWEWSQAVADTARLRKHIVATFGWPLFVDANTKTSTLKNFPMQANGAEMLRIACILMHERGIEVCAPVHDAVLIEAGESEAGPAVHEAQRAMGDASRIVLGGFELRSDSKVLRAGDRFLEPRGKPMWQRMEALLARTEAARARHGTTGGAHTSTCSVSSISSERDLQP